jgi:hypothetical protein
MGGIQDPYDACILRSTDQGVTWIPVSEGFDPDPVTSLEIVGTDLYAGTAGGWVWKRPLSELTSETSGLGRGNPRAGRSGKRMLMGEAEKASTIKKGIPLRDVSGRLLLPNQADRRGPAFLPARSHSRDKRPAQIPTLKDVPQTQPRFSVNGLDPSRTAGL